MASALALTGCGGSSGSSEKEQEPEPEPVVAATTNYEVYRADVQQGVTGTPQMVSELTYDYSSDFAILQPDGAFSFEIQGVPYNGKVSRGRETTHLYSGIEDYPATEMLFEGRGDAEVGSVLVSGYFVDDQLQVLLTTGIDGTWTQACFYLRPVA
jgi:hypothetical protein